MVQEKGQKGEGEKKKKEVCEMTTELERRTGILQDDWLGTIKTCN